MIVKNFASLLQIAHIWKFWYKLIHSTTGSKLTLSLCNEQVTLLPPLFTIIMKYVSFWANCKLCKLYLYKLRPFELLLYELFLLKIIIAFAYVGFKNLVLFGFLAHAKKNPVFTGKNLIWDLNGNTRFESRLVPRKKSILIKRRLIRVC